MSFGVFRQAITGTRRAPDTLLKGRKIDGAESAISLNGSVQPITGNERQTLPEGIRERARYAIYTDYALRTDDQTAKTPADTLDLFGKKYKVVIVEPWQNGLINHYRAIVSEAD